MQPEQMRFHGGEAVTTGKRQRHRLRMPDHPHEMRLSEPIVGKHPAPEGPEAGRARILERPDPVVGDLRQDQRPCFVDQGVKARRRHQRIVRLSDQVPFERQGSHQPLVEFKNVLVLPVPLCIVRRGLEGEIFSEGYAQCLQSPGYQARTRPVHAHDDDYAVFHTFVSCFGHDW